MVYKHGLFTSEKDNNPLPHIYAILRLWTPPLLNWQKPLKSHLLALKLTSFT